MLSQLRHLDLWYSKQSGNFKNKHVLAMVSHVWVSSFVVWVCAKLWAKLWKLKSRSCAALDNILEIAFVFPMLWTCATNCLKMSALFFVEAKDGLLLSIDLWMNQGQQPSITKRSSANPSFVHRTMGKTHAFICKHAGCGIWHKSPIQMLNMFGSCM